MMMVLTMTRLVPNKFIAILAGAHVANWQVDTLLFAATSNLNWCLVLEISSMGA